jgi:hypothetical protein
MFYAFPGASSWHAGSGAIFDLKSNALRPAGWTSADAAGLAIFPYLVRYDEIVGGEINHAIRLTAPQTRNTYIWPARHKASSLTGSQYPPMGQRFRLKASFDISGFSPTNQVILRALKKYGMILADNGSAWYMSGVPDERWNNSDLNKLKGVLGSNFEAIDESSLMIDPNSAQARQTATGISVSVSPSTASVQVNGTRQFAATVSGSSNQGVTWLVNGVPGGSTSVGTISAAGLYTAPAAVPAPATVNVQARSVADPAKSGSALVTITLPAPPPPPPPPPPSSPVMYLSVGTNGNVGTVTPLAVANEDIVAWYGGNSFGLFFDGSDVGLSALTIDAFDVVSGSELLLSFTSSATIGGISVDDSDVVRFSGTLGPVTSGTFSMFLDASDVGLTTSNEDIDAIQRLPDGRLLVSTTGDFSVPGPGGSAVNGADEDVLAFQPSAGGLGDASSAGTWSLYFDGSDVGMSASGEDVDGLSVDAAGKLYLSTTGGLSVPGPSGTTVTGANEDVAVFTPTTLGTATSGTFSASLFFDGSLHGLSGNDIFEIDLP